MPIYEYQCETCGERVEVIQKHSDPPSICPKCGGEMKKLHSAPAIQFKGSGFYKTDYPSSTASSSSSSSEGSGKSESSSESKSDSKSESKSESKPETKSESKSETKSDTKTSA
jgi:putative FmdB family regulatory protein